jgi:hypothetical protein
VLFLVNESHLARLKEGVAVWNKWRQENPSITPELSKANLRCADLSQANLSQADLYDADLYYANLSQANLSGAGLCRADLARTNLSEANLSGANLFETNLIGKNLSGANLSGANLNGANLNGAKLNAATFNGANLNGVKLNGAEMRRAVLVEVQLNGATLTDCNVYGISTWGLTGLEEAEQSNLVITPPDEPIITVDNLEVAQFVYLMLHSEKIRNVINTIGSKGVLILGRFTERKYVLDAIRSKLRDLGFVPFVFDFEKPTDRDFSETVLTLAGISRFIVADITQPKSVPLELKTVVPNYQVPMVTIIQKGEKPFSMFKDLWIEHEDSVLEPVRYESIDKLLAVFQQAVIDRANERYTLLQKKKAKEMKILDVDDFMECKQLPSSNKTEGNSVE